MTDSDTHAFVAHFLADVAELAGARSRADAAVLLWDALGHGGDAWRPLYRIVATIVHASYDDRNRAAFIRLQTFLNENIDLAERRLVNA